MFKKILSLAVIFLALFSTQTFAQLNDAGQILKAGKQDANTLLRAYFKPLGKGFGKDLNTGWVETAKPHKTLGFDIRVNVSAAAVPNSDQSFNVENLPLKRLEYDQNNSDSPITPTAFGDDETGPTLAAYSKNPRQKLFEFDMPQGSGFSYVPAPTIQASLGLIKSTDITVRYVPNISLPKDIDVNMWGIGVKHGLNQWIPGGKLLPVDLSVQLGYTKLNSSIDFDVRPDPDADTKNDYKSSTWNGQQGKFDSQAFTVNALAGKTFPIISFYVGLGYETSKVNLSTPGSYPVTVPNDNYNPIDPTSKPKKIKKVDNPVDVSYDNNSSFHGMIGTRIKIAIISITGSYTVSKYPTAQLGFGISFR